MDVGAENLPFESMDLDSFAENWVMGSLWGIGDGFLAQELQQKMEPLPFFGYNENLASSSSPCSPPFSCSGLLSLEFAQSVSSYLEKQRLEMNMFLQSELAIGIEKYESRIRSLMQKKDEELVAVMNITLVLEDLLKKAETKAKAWEKKAKEKDVIAMDLRNKLNRVREKHCLFPNAAQAHQNDDDVVSFSDSSSSANEENLKKQETDCKFCYAAELCVVFFPCRHLCSCKSCEVLLGHCPICGTSKEASLEVFLV